MPKDQLELDLAQQLPGEDRCPDCNGERYVWRDYEACPMPCARCNPTPPVARAKLPDQPVSAWPPKGK